MFCLPNLKSLNIKLSCKNHQSSSIYNFLQSANLLINENQFRNFKYFWHYQVKLRIQDWFNLSSQILEYIFENLRRIHEIKSTFKTLFSNTSIFWATGKIYTGSFLLRGNFKTISKVGKMYNFIVLWIIVYRAENLPISSNDFCWYFFNCINIYLQQKYTFTSKIRISAVLSLRIWNTECFNNLQNRKSKHVKSIAFKNFALKKGSEN